MCVHCGYRTCIVCEWSANVVTYLPAVYILGVGTSKFSEEDQVLEEQAQVALKIR